MYGSVWRERVRQRWLSGYGVVALGRMIVGNSLQLVPVPVPVLESVTLYTMEGR